MIAPRIFTQGQQVRDKRRPHQGTALIATPGKWMSDVVYPDGRKVQLANTQLEIAQEVVTAALIIVLCYGPIVAAGAYGFGWLS